MRHIGLKCAITAGLICVARASATGDEAILDFLRSQDSRRAIEVDLDLGSMPVTDGRVVRSLWPLPDGTFLEGQRELPMDGGEAHATVRVLSAQGVVAYSEVIPGDAHVHEVHFAKAQRWPGVTYYIDHGSAVIFFPVNGNERTEFVVASDENMLVDADAGIICSNAARMDAAPFNRQRDDGVSETWTRFTNFAGRPVPEVIESVVDDSAGVIQLTRDRVVVRETRGGGGTVLKAVNLASAAIEWTWKDDNFVAAFPIRNPTEGFSFAMLQAPEWFVCRLFDLRTGVIRGDLPLLSSAQLDADGRIYGTMSEWDRAAGHVEYAGCFGPDGNLRGFGMLPPGTPVHSTHVGRGCMALQFTRPDDGVNWTAVYDFRAGPGDTSGVVLTVVPVLLRGTWALDIEASHALSLSGVGQSGDFMHLVIDADTLEKRGRSVRW